LRPTTLRDLLAAVADGSLPVAEAVERLRHLPYEDLPDARVDHHRELRQGAPEVIFGAGKTPQQVASITRALLEAGSNVLCTRASPEAAAAVVAVAPDAHHDEAARTVTVVREPPRELGRVGVLCAGTSDLPVAREAVVSAEFFGARVKLASDVGVAGLHRLLGSMDVLRESDVLIVVAGMEGALPSVVGGLTAAPVVAVPTSVGYGASLGGLTALLAMLSSCASGVTVVNIDNGFGAAAAAHRMLHGLSKRLT
jgi:NCAIR mutase (PurE)-related protein